MGFLSVQARIRPHKLAVEDLTFNRRWTYAEFELCVAQIATKLRQQHVVKGDRVACLSKNRAEIVALHIACASVGAIFVPLNWRLSLDELKRIMTDCEPRLLFADNIGEKHGLQYLKIADLFEETQHLKPQSESVSDPKTPSLMLYTSGTTGNPKGVILSEGNLDEAAINFTILGKVDIQSRFLAEAPMFHIIGLVTSVRPALYFGATILISDGFIPERTLNRISDETLGITHYFCVPQMANALRQEPTFDPLKLKGLTALFTGGAPHPEVQIRTWLNDGIPIVDGYGMSEAGTVFGMPIDLQLIAQKAGCVGFATSRVKVRLIKDDGCEAECGEPGEVQLKGKNITQGYWRREEEFLASLTDDGWFCTGDIATKDADGYYRIVDRKKDMFISGGENVYPTEVEAVVLKLESVLECSLIGVPDERWGEVGCLFIVLKSGYQLEDKQAILSFLEIHLARYKLPKYMKSIDNLPRNGGGKVMKHVLRAAFKTD